MNELGSSLADMASELRDTKEVNNPNIDNYKDIKPQEGVTAKEAKSYWKEEFSKRQDNNDGMDSGLKDSKVEQRLTDEEKQKIKEETGWSDGIVNYIDSMDQYRIYKEANLQEVVINGRECLVKNIDLNYKDPKTGMNNSERMVKGLAPIDSKSGEKITIHHMMQDFNGPFAELCENSEHGDGNDLILHPKQGESWRSDPEKKNEYQKQRIEHWRSRA